jgi:hypothetical protein
MDEFDLLKLTGKSVNIMCTLNKKCAGLVVIKKGKESAILAAAAGCIVATICLTLVQFFCKDV